MDVVTSDLLWSDDKDGVGWSAAKYWCCAWGGRAVIKSEGGAEAKKTREKLYTLHHKLELVRAKIRDRKLLLDDSLKDVRLWFCLRSLLPLSCRFNRKYFVTMSWYRGRQHAEQCRQVFLLFCVSTLCVVCFTLLSTICYVISKTGKLGCALE